MTKSHEIGNPGGIWAPLTNLMLGANALERSMDRASALPGIVVVYGPSGYGKTMAASYCANRFNGVYVECRSFFTAKSLMTAIMKEARLRPERTLADMLDAIVAELSASRRPLIVDEVDHIVETKTLQVIRDIHDASGCAVMVIGEEALPRKLARTERFHNRVLSWVMAQPASDADAAKLVAHHCAGITVAEDLVRKMRVDCRGVSRRIAVSCAELREWAARKGLKQVSAADWGDRTFFPGEPPRRASHAA